MVSYTHHRSTGIERLVNHHHYNQPITLRFLAGLFGVGGGAVTVPALTLCLGVSHYQARFMSLIDGDVCMRRVEGMT